MGLHTAWGQAVLGRKASLREGKALREGSRRTKHPRGVNGVRTDRRISTQLGDPGSQEAGTSRAHPEALSGHTVRGKVKLSNRVTWEKAGAFQRGGAASASLGNLNSYPWKLIQGHPCVPCKRGLQPVEAACVNDTLGRCDGSTRDADTTATRCPRLCRAELATREAAVLSPAALPPTIWGV